MTLFHATHDPMTSRNRTLRAGQLRMPDMTAKLEFLQTVEAYGQSGPCPKCIETHMSWVFLVGDKVFKLKKPVRFPYLDFTTLQAREFYCREEVRLNARLAPGVYLGIVALQWCDGHFALAPERCPQPKPVTPGKTVDWLVSMRRLPGERTLHKLIAQSTIVSGDIDALIEVLDLFYRGTPAVTLSANEYVTRFHHDQASNREVLLRPQFHLRDASLALDRLATALENNVDRLCDRVHQHRVIEGHGDLRPEHVFLLEPPVVIDCLEFNPQLRQIDPFDEIAYLGMECDMLGAPWVSQRLTSGFAHALGDHPAPALMQLYTAHRALLRARLIMAHLLDPQPRTPEIWPPLAARYIERALVALNS